jgi:uncharacterized protein YbjT (DUF2867 family)
MKVSTIRERQAMRILVTQPTGTVGNRVVRELLEPEFSVRVLTPEPAGLSEGVRDQVEVMRGSTDDAEALRQALDGVEAVFWCVPTESPRVSDIHVHDERHARAARSALRRAGTARVVVVSVAGELARQARASPSLKMEEIFNESGWAFRHLHCGLLMETFLAQAESILQNGLLSFPVQGDIGIPLVAARDVADEALRWLVRRDWEGTKRVAVNGSVSLTLNEAAAVLERVLQRPVRYREAPANQYIRNLVGSGTSLEYARGQVSMFTELTLGARDVEEQPDDSVASTTLAAWAESELLPKTGGEFAHTGSETVMSPS